MLGALVLLVAVNDPYSVWLSVSTEWHSRYYMDSVVSRTHVSRFTGNKVAQEWFWRNGQLARYSRGHIENPRDWRVEEFWDDSGVSITREQFIIAKTMDEQWQRALDKQD